MLKQIIKDIHIWFLNEKRELSYYLRSTKVGEKVMDLILQAQLEIGRWKEAEEYEKNLNERPLSEVDKELTEAFGGFIPVKPRPVSSLDMGILINTTVCSGAKVAHHSSNTVEVCKSQNADRSYAN